MVPFNIKHLVYLGSNGFPLGMASAQRQKLISKSIMRKLWQVTIICNRGVHSPKKNVSKNGIHDGVYYKYFFSSNRIENFFLRNIVKFAAPFWEIYVLYKIKSKKGITAAIVSDRNLIWNAIKYRLFSKMVGFHLYLNFVEVYKDRTNERLVMKINDWIFNKWGLYFYDGILPISNYIVEEVTKYKKKYLHLPILTDIEKIDQINIEKQSTVLYCGSAAYYDAISLILKSFIFLRNTEVRLILVINGTLNEMKRISDDIIEYEIEDCVEIKNNLSDQELFKLYKSSKALILPLFNRVQDIARFPHKLGEYLASGSVVITHEIGEIKNYLSHMENVIFLKDYKPKELAENITWVLKNEVKADKIGKKGRDISVSYFDYRIYSKSLDNFLSC